MVNKPLIRPYSWGGSYQQFRWYHPNWRNPKHLYVRCIRIRLMDTGSFAPPQKYSLNLKDPQGPSNGGVSLNLYNRGV